MPARVPGGPFTNRHLGSREVQVLDAHTKGLQNTQARRVLQRNDQARNSIEFADDPGDFVLRQDDGQPFGPPGADDPLDAVEGLFEDPLIQEQHSRQRLVLGRRGHVPVDGQMGEESVDVGFVEIPWMRPLVKDQEPFDPMDVGLLGPAAVMVDSQNFDQPIVESR